MAFEKYIIPEEDGPKMALHLFIAVLSEYLNNQDVTKAMGKAAFEAHLGVTLSINEALDITNSINYIDASGAMAKALRLDELYRVLVLAEHDTWYNSLTLLRDRLNWSQPD